MNSKQKNKIDPSTESASSQLEETQKKQGLVTQRMIGMHQSRTRRGRLFKFLSALTLCIALTVTGWWVLLQFKEPDQNWSELIQYLVQRIVS
ncbi:hypothetical protein OAM37_04365 [bacterium]|nr:hypothetical protein [bacterium]